MTARVIRWIVALFLLAIPSTQGAESVRREIRFPDLPGYKTLKCDLHTHTVFSDGLVWPTVRVAEAWRQGLDAISITDHIEYQPHKEDVPKNLNRSYELAAGAARACDLLLVRGAEITRDTPPGHFNAVFIRDANPMDVEDFLKAIQMANEQRAFVFWNHQGWKGPEKGKWLDVHTTMFENRWFQGMEVCNGDEYYPDAHRWCLDRNLTLLGNSDVHEPDLRTQSATADHRTMTLVVAKEKSLAALQEALREGRTIVWYQGQLIGREVWLRPFFDACLRLSGPHSRSKNGVVCQLANCSEIDIQLERSGATGPPKITVPAGTTAMLRIETETPDKTLELDYTVTNFLVAPATGLTVTLRVPGT